VPKRQTGTTTQQILNAAKNAIYVCAHYDMTNYVRQLAHELGRDDLEIVPISKFSTQFWRGRNLPIVIDHYVLDLIFDGHFKPYVDDLREAVHKGAIGQSKEK